MKKLFLLMLLLTHQYLTYAAIIQTPDEKYTIFRVKTKIAIFDNLKNNLVYKATIGEALQNKKYFKCNDQIAVFDNYKYVYIFVLESQQLFKFEHDGINNVHLIPDTNNYVILEKNCKEFYLFSTQSNKLSRSFVCCLDLEEPTDFRLSTAGTHIIIKHPKEESYRKYEINGSLLYSTPMEIDSI